MPVYPLTPDAPGDAAENPLVPVYPLTPDAPPGAEYLMETLSSSTVGTIAVVSSHTHELAGIVASLNEVISSPVVRSVVMVPPVITSLPALVLSE